MSRLLKAGAAARDITPQLGMPPLGVPALGVPLAGAFTARYAEGVEDALHARAVVLEDERGPESRVAVVCCDLICMPGETVHAARELIERAGDVPPGRVFVAATHTHTAPAPTGLLGTPRADAYMDALPEEIAAAVRDAARGLRLARAGWGTGRVEGVTFNRRFRMRDGTVRMNPGRRNADALEPVGPVDPELGVVWVEEGGSPERRPIAAIGCFALHYVGTDNSRHVSADYFGRYAGWLRRAYGSEWVAMLLNGTSGDINNVDVREVNPTGGARQAERVAGMLAGETIKVAEGLRTTTDARLEVASERVRFRRKTITAEDLRVAERILAVPAEVPDAELRKRTGIGDGGSFSWVVGEPLRASVLRAYARECQLVAELPEELDTEVMAVRIGEAALVGLPGEIFVELGLAIKARSPFGTTLVASLANDYVGYVPTRRAQLEEGGYETWAARSALPDAGTGEVMVETAVRLLERLAA
ncbi:MAG TPA: hypothetical protein VFX49_16535 [Chloroflexota bacterium]|nr:hypothetical protein [Chloroflexota bacterium]